ncbi:Cas10/Cmr2 second palm domain-containing protein [Propionibacterium australiense]|uniref:GGDEF domain profile n=1 Tax=Propionibacterium australiense TaxID=119981 RepID=A0A383S4Q3_9ACTN|nr:hypothetical protein [Propionibacterium australiense]RLP10059.1 hypothetical protein D9T14_05865 [Propionibacterium australiense]RLP11344.1 hypothetical protein D7U36_04305 [Propionibacterium australiense]SYZ32980.1 GGDEF domain profile [Propionibacterium australiense]VEH92309.1 CRISPR-associated protein Cas10/Cmr2, subtype III-B [Propionibacterium australiense]
MTTYATVGLQRIQTYLARSRSLWGRRGASEELVQLTALPEKSSPDRPADTELTVTKILGCHPGVEINPEGLDIDGVVSLCSKPGAATDAKQVVEAATALAAKIRERLPGVTIKISHIQSDKSYAELSRNLDSWSSMTWYPLATEFPAARLCDECRLDPAAGIFKDHDDKELRLCNDCSSHHGAEDRWRKRTLTSHSKADDRTGDIPTRFTTEGWLLRRLRAAPEYEGLTFSEHFEDLGQLGALQPDNTRGGNQLRGRTHEGNHTALIFADGNGMGALFNDLLTNAADHAGDGDSTKDVREVSKTIKKGTSEALLEATKQILASGEKVCPVVPHINGGDDVLVSVTAPRAWRFLRSFLDILKGSLTELSEKHGQPLSMSAGMVICKAEYPFANQVELAEVLMRNAKSAVHGKDWSFAWLDVTHDGLDPNTHDPWTLDRLSRCEKALRHLRSDMTAHGETALVRALAGDRDSRGTLLDHLTCRMPEVKTLLRLLHVSDPKGITDEQTTLINDLISIGRWWR